MAPRWLTLRVSKKISRTLIQTKKKWNNKQQCFIRNLFTFSFRCFFSAERLWNVKKKLTQQENFWRSISPAAQRTYSLRFFILFYFLSQTIICRTILLSTTAWDYVYVIYNEILYFMCTNQTRSLLVPFARHKCDWDNRCLCAVAACARQLACAIYQYQFSLRLTIDGCSLKNSKLRVPTYRDETLGKLFCCCVALP